MKKADIFKIGLLVGTFDIVTAFVDFYLQPGKNPVIVLQCIASGIVGKAPYQGNFGYPVFRIAAALRYRLYLYAVACSDVSKAWIIPFYAERLNPRQTFKSNVYGKDAPF
jgi:hypothetical protein